jgi:asparagine synthase (glutamine-hydrolysing)
VSALLGVFGNNDREVLDRAIDRMLGRMSKRGNERRAVWHEDGVTLAVSRNDWELSDDFSGGVMLLVEPDLVVAADGFLLYREDLRRHLAAAGVESTGPTTSHLIGAAYRAWEEDCSSHLEGEFAFLIWDRRRRRGLGSRDFLGKRPLYYARLNDRLVVASTIGGVLGHPRVPQDLDLISVASTAAGMMSAGSETCFSSVSSLPAGSNVCWTTEGTAGPRRYWEPHLDPEDKLPFEDAAERLQQLLVAAVDQRIAPSGATGIWTSGGWDSSAVFAAGQALLASEHPGQSIVPISISYPEGDPGREDELIQLIASRWSASVKWIPIASIPYFPPGGEDAPASDEPFRHPFEFWNRALAAATRAAGSRIALDGNGGDQNFQVSHAYLADLFRSGRWLALIRDIRALGGIDSSTFFSLVLRPALPGPVRRMIESIRGRPARLYGQHWMPGWFRKEFGGHEEIMERERGSLPDPSSSNRTRAETLWYWNSPFLQRAMAMVSGFALEEGIELRSPLADRRIVEFALRRPRWERAGGGETKRLLRESMRHWLPAEVLAPRAQRTGTTDGFAHDQMTRHFPALQARMLEQPMMLEELGIINAESFARAGRSYRHRSQASLRVALWSTYQAETWLRARKRQTG